MSVATADLEKAINTVWDASGLDAIFQALWDAAVAVAEFPVLHDQTAGGEQPWPYCVYEVSSGSTIVRSSKGINDLWEDRDVPLSFRVHARLRDGDARTPKEIAAYLIEEVMKVFGGHPTQAPTDLVLDNGNFLVTLYQNDYAIREDEDRYQWILSYTIRIDVPVMETAV